MSNNGVSVVIPALNEEDAISGTVRELFEAFQAAGEPAFEVIVVDDGSADRTGMLAVESGARVIRHPHNVGYGRSLKDGIAAASHETVVITDADGTYPISEIPALLELYREGYDMVVGQRTGDKYRESALKAPLRILLRSLVEFTSGRRIPDINSGLRVFRRSHALQFEPRLCDTFSYTTSLTLAFMMNGCFVTYKPIPYYERIGQTKVRLVKDSVRTLQYICEAAVYYNPMKIFGAMSAVLFAFGLLLLLVNVLLRTQGLFFLGIGSWIAAMLTFGMGLLAVSLKPVQPHPLRAGRHSESED